MTSNPTALRPAEDLAHARAGHLAFLAEARPAGAHDAGIGGFARDFATADGGRVMVAAFTPQQFADLARATGRAGTFAFLERVLYADFSAADDLHTHRGTIAALLAPWFARCTVGDLAAAFAGTSVSWARLPDLTARPGSRSVSVAHGRVDRGNLTAGLLQNRA
jgi:2-methylfumaryl-CoA isomerase